MNRKEAAKILPIIKAYAEGKTIQVADTTDQCGMWEDVIDLKINTDFEEYRIKPEPKYRPFANAEECWKEMLKHQPFGWIYGGSYYSIVSISNETVNIVNDTRDIIECLFSEMIEEGCTFVDGIPFGVKTKE